MGQQQLLLIVLSVIIVGIAVAVGITMFGEQAAQANLDGVVADLQGLGARAHQYYMKPPTLGGGGKSFVGLTADAAGMLNLASRDSAETDNGKYAITVLGTATGLTITGYGVEDGDGDGTNVQVTLTVLVDPSADRTAIVNR